MSSFWRNARKSLARALGFEVRHSQALYGELLGRMLRPGDRWLDIGCGHQILPEWALPEAEQRALVERAGLLVGSDLDPAMAAHPHLQAAAFADLEKLPFDDASFDLITTNMVVEHLERPEPAFREAARALRPGGRLVIHTPNRLYYLILIASVIPDGLKRRIIKILEHREEQDVFPTHYRANTGAALGRQLRAAGLDVESLEMVGSVGSFQFLGPLGVAEVFILRLLSLGAFRRFRADILAVARKAG